MLTIVELNRSGPDDFPKWTGRTEDGRDVRAEVTRLGAERWTREFKIRISRKPTLQFLESNNSATAGFLIQIRDTMGDLPDGTLDRMVEGFRCHNPGLSLADGVTFGPLPLVDGFGLRP